MLVSKIKPCKSKFKQVKTVKLRMAHYIGPNIHHVCTIVPLDNRGNSRANTRGEFSDLRRLLDIQLSFWLVTENNRQGGVYAATWL